MELPWIVPSLSVLVELKTPHISAYRLSYNECIVDPVLERGSHLSVEAWMWIDFATNLGPNKQVPNEVCSYFSSTGLDDKTWPSKAERPTTCVP